MSEKDFENKHAFALGQMMAVENILDNICLKKMKSVKEVIDYVRERYRLHKKECSHTLNIWSGKVSCFVEKNIGFYQKNVFKFEQNYEFEGYIDEDKIVHITTIYNSGLDKLREAFLYKSMPFKTFIHKRMGDIYHVNDKIAYNKMIVNHMIFTFNPNKTMVAFSEKKASPMIITSNDDEIAILIAPIEINEDLKIR